MLKDPECVVWASCDESPSIWGIAEVTETEGQPAVAYMVSASTPLDSYVGPGA